MSTDKKVETWMPLLVDKYLGDTTDLTTEQHGAYLLLLMSCWKKGGLLPLADERLRAITRLDPDRWEECRDVVMPFFERTPEGYSAAAARVHTDRPLFGYRRHLPAVLERCGRRCWYCGCSGIVFELDHIMPRSRGGSDDPENLVPACGPCNRSKGARTPEEWAAA